MEEVTINITEEVEQVTINVFEGGSIDIDDTVTKDSQNAVKSSGIWAFVTDLFTSFLATIKGIFQPFHGFENRTDSVISAADSAGWKFTIAPVTTSYNVWSGKKKQTITDSKTVAIPDDLTLYFITIDGDGNLSASPTAWDIEDFDNAPVAIFFRDGLDYALTDERHGYKRNVAWHKWAHNNIGAMYKSGLTGTFLDASFSITQGQIADEDINFNTGGTKITTTHWRRAVSLNTMRLTRNNTTIYPTIGGVMAYDLNGVLTAMDANRYGTYWVYGSNDDQEPIYTVVSQAQYNNVAQARNAPAPTIYLSTAEWKLLYRVIYRNTAPITYIEAADFRTVQTGTPISATTQDHSALINRDAANSHPASAITVSEAPVADYTKAALNDTMQAITGKVLGVQELLVDYTLDANAASITFTYDKNGNLINIPTGRNFVIFLDVPNFKDATNASIQTRANLRVNGIETSSYQTLNTTQTSIFVSGTNSDFQRSEINGFVNEKLFVFSQTNISTASSNQIFNAFTNFEVVSITSITIFSLLGFLGLGTRVTIKLL